MSQAKPTELNQRYVDVSHADLPLHCPLPSMKLWNTHPRVFLAIEGSGEALCPYCGTKYKLSGWAGRPSH